MKKYQYDMLLSFVPGGKKPKDAAMNAASYKIKDKKDKDDDDDKKMSKAKIAKTALSLLGGGKMFG